MKRVTAFVLLGFILSVFNIQFTFAGPFGIDMGMNLLELEQVCKTAPKHITDDKYEITPPQTNALFKTYIVAIDPDYGVYWLKAIGRDVSTNDYGTELRSVFFNLIKSLSKTYGEESYIKDSVQERSIWADKKYFMTSLLRGDRTLCAVWDKETDVTRELLKDPLFKEKILSLEGTTEEQTHKILSDTTFIKKILLDKLSTYQKLPEQISTIGIIAKAESSSSGYVVLEYYFSNDDKVKNKADSVF